MWDWKSIIDYELLPPGKTINSYLYYQQLMQLKQEVGKKRPELINSSKRNAMTVLSRPRRRTFAGLPPVAVINNREFIF
ncbi:hypothetical protein EVAR_83287_1 [Eumeta japonica]|uniref:Uncharacterized protein n=1 Tax=Eumeta variegata TaxID=151549 RepID=A0A4C1X703_EUMVA|nr:hypothetical protein EVAR_83287_1 [Eumeta japonica]